MTVVSPLLQAKLNNSANYGLTKQDHEAIYKDLQKHANDVKPNEAKAKLIKEGPVTSAISAVKDTFQDAKNFKKAVKTGKLCDNSLGRLNDLGMKMGAVLIACYLATQQRSKTESIMQFVGGGTFFAVMALWPKLAINLPARKVHGFDIGQRYISAQGDKKDFFLDNQFLPWDAYSKNEMREIGKRTGIDIDSENGEEKIRRKMQKTALQNRTLWMATAGFSTPLLTSLFGHAVTPKIKDSVIKHGFEKTKSIVENGDIEKHLRYAQPDVMNSRAIEALFNQYKGKDLDENFYTILADMIQLRAPEYQTTLDGKALLKDAKGNFFKHESCVFKDMGDYNPVKNCSGSIDETVAVLKEMAASTASIDTKKVEEGLRNIKSGLGKSISDKQIKEMMEAIGEDASEEAVRNVLKSHKIKAPQIQSIIDASKGNMDTSKFLDIVKKYNTDYVGEIRGRLKAYLNLLNPIVGKKEESVYTKEYMDTFDNLYNMLDIPYRKGGAPSLKTMHNNSDAIRQNYIDYFSSKAKNLNDDEYKEFIGDLLVQNKAATKQKMSGLNKLITKTQAKESKNVFDNIILKLATPLRDTLSKRIKSEKMFAQKEEVLDKLLNDENLDLIVPEELQGKLTDAIMGDKEKATSVKDIIKRFVGVQRVNIESVEALPIISANFEKRVANGEFSDLTKGQLEVARTIVNEGNINLKNNNAYLRNKNLYDGLINRIYDTGKFDVEESVVPGIKESVRKIKELNGNPEENYARAADLVSQTKTYMKRLFNDKHWEHIFIPMAVALVVVTLVSQHFFGKIDDEYPEKKGGDK